MSEIKFTKPLTQMTVAELTEARLSKAPLHCRTMQKRLAGKVVFSDIEELSEELLNATVRNMIADGWRYSGVYFVRTAGGAS